MRKLKILAHVSLDGVIQTNDESGGVYGDWTAPYRTPAGREAVAAAHGDRFDLLLGRRTYDQWSAYWPKAPSSPMADGLNAALKYVATHRPESLAWGPFEAIGPDVAEGVRKLKQLQRPDLLVWGSTTLTSTLLAQGLADEVLLIVYPVLVGVGTRFFKPETPACSLELVTTQALASGVVFTTYRLAAPLTPRA